MANENAQFDYNQEENQNDSVSISFDTKDSNCFDNAYENMDEDVMEVFDLDGLEEQLKGELQEKFLELKILDEEKEKIGNPDNIGNVMMNVVWEQFMNQIAQKAGEDFIKKNHGLHLDLRDSVHIQTAENFSKGKIAIHNYKGREQLEQNYDRYSNKSHREFREEYVNRGMNKVLKRAGELNKQGVETVTDIYNGRQIPTQKKLENGKDNPNAAQREHVIPSAKLYENPALQMANNDTELAEIINNPENLQGYTSAQRNNRKRDNSPDEMSEQDKNKHWEKANERAEEYIKKEEEEGKARLKKEGRQTQKEEAFRIGGKALRAAVMQLLSELVKEIFSKLIKWLRSAKRVWGTLLDSLKEAIHSFFGKLKEHLINTGNTVLSTVATAIVGPIFGVIKKGWMILKQGWNSLMEAFKYLTNPENKGKSTEIVIMEVGKIIIGGFTATGALVLGEVIEKGLMAVPIFAIEIQLIGSLANILGMLFGAIAAGIIGAMGINFLDKMIADKQKKEVQATKFEKQNQIIANQHQVRIVNEVLLERDKGITQDNISKRHEKSTSIMRDSFESIMEDFVKPLPDIIDDETVDETNVILNAKIEKIRVDLRALLESLD